MPVSYGVVATTAFPTQPWQTEQQTSLVEDQVATAIEPVTDWVHEDYRKFRVRHESTLHLEGRYHNQPITEVVQVFRFDIFVDGLGMALPRAPKKIWHEAFRRMEADQEHILQYAPVELDLVTLRTKLTARIGGGWFGKLAIAKVQTAGIFGPDVASSDEWLHYEQSGELSSIQMEISFEGEDMPIMLGRDYTLVLYRDLGEMTNLALVSEVRRLVSEALGP